MRTVTRVWILVSLIVCIILPIMVNNGSSSRALESNNDSRLVCNSNLNTDDMPGISLPESSTDGQFIDRVLIFETPSTEYIFEFNFTKNKRYDFYLQLYMPEVDLTIEAVLVGMDADENEIEDVYTLAAGELIEEDDQSRKGSFTFSCPETGAYTLTLTGTSTENTNVYFSVSDMGIASEEGGMILDVSGYHDDQERQYYIDLNEDTMYSISVQRVTSLSTQVVNSLSVSIDLYDFEGRVYHIVKNQPLWSIFDDSDTAKEFGTAIKGQYRFVVHIDTDIEVTDIMFILQYERAIGDGPEPTEPTEPGEDRDPTLISISTLVPFIPIGIVVGAVAVFSLFYIGKKSKSRTPRIQ